MEKYAETGTLSIEFAEDEERKPVGWREMLQMHDYERKRRQMERYNLDLKRLLWRKIAGIVVMLAAIIALVFVAIVFFN